MAKFEIPIRITDIEFFKELISIAKDAKDDKRIDESIRDEYADRCSKAMDKSKKELNSNG